jgi:hypothetical protein
LFEHLGSTSQTITRFTNRVVENELFNVKSLHGIGSSGLLFGTLERKQNHKVKRVQSVKVTSMEKGQSISMVMVKEMKGLVAMPPLPGLLMNSVLAAIRLQSYNASETVCCLLAGSILVR